MSQGLQAEAVSLMLYIASVALNSIIAMRSLQAIVDRDLADRHSLAPEMGSALK